MIPADLDDAALKKDLEATMQRYGVAAIVYTRDDDGLHARLHDGQSKRLGWLEADPTPKAAPSRQVTDLFLALAEKWEACSRNALPVDAMLINKHIREMRETIARGGQ